MFPRQLRCVTGLAPWTLPEAMDDRSFDDTQTFSKRYTQILKRTVTGALLQNDVVKSTCFAIWNRSKTNLCKETSCRAGPGYVWFRSHRRASHRRKRRAFHRTKTTTMYVCTALTLTKQILAMTHRVPNQSNIERQLQQTLLAYSRALDATHSILLDTMVSNAVSKTWFRKNAWNFRFLVGSRPDEP